MSWPPANHRLRTTVLNQVFLVITAKDRAFAKWLLRNTPAPLNPAASAVVSLSPRRCSCCLSTGRWPYSAYAAARKLTPASRRGARCMREFANWKRTAAIGWPRRCSNARKCSAS